MLMEWWEDGGKWWEMVGRWWEMVGRWREMVGKGGQSSELRLKALQL